MITVLTPSSIGRLLPEQPPGLPTITIYRSGRIRLSGSLAAEMGVAGGDAVALIHQDGHLSIAASRIDSGWTLKDGNAPCFYSSDLVRWLSELLDIPFDKVSRVRYEVASDPQYVNGFNHYKILTDDAQ